MSEDTTQLALLQALQSDTDRWESMLRSAGSPQHILRMADSQRGDAKWSLGERAGHFLPYHVFDFWLNLALCHALLVEKDDDGNLSYQVCASLCCTSLPLSRSMGLGCGMTGAARLMGPTQSHKVLSLALQRCARTSRHHCACQRHIWHRICASALGL